MDILLDYRLVVQDSLVRLQSLGFNRDGFVSVCLDT